MSVFGRSCAQEASSSKIEGNEMPPSINMDAEELKPSSFSVGKFLHRRAVQRRWSKLRTRADSR